MDTKMPFQIESLINNLLNNKENVHSRSNYRMRLDLIREEINKAIKKYDNEIIFSDTSKYKKKKA